MNIIIFFIIQNIITKNSQIKLTINSKTLNEDWQYPRKVRAKTFISNSTIKMLIKVFSANSKCLCLILNFWQRFMLKTYK